MPVRRGDDTTSDEDIVVRNAVFEALEEILCLPRAKFSVTDRLGRDLKADSDDLSFWFIPKLEERLDVKVPFEEWSDVYTVQDVINLLKKHCKRKRGQ